MSDIVIVRSTSSSIVFTIGNTVTFSKARLWASSDGSDPIIIDEITTAGSASPQEVLRVNLTAGEFTIELNKVPFDTILYKSFYLEFFDVSDELIHITDTFGLSPSAPLSIKGVVAKLHHDFSVMASISGSVLRVFLPNILAPKCPECWDEELGQRTSSSCTTCGGTGVKYHPEDIIAKRVKTQSKQTYSGQGVMIDENVIFITYSRLNFTKGILVVDMASREIYEIADNTSATIGGIRTSTTIITSQIKSNDSRVSGIFPLM